MTPDGPEITVRYSCALCGLARVEAAVPARTTENVVEWMEQVAIVALAADHRRRSPNCHPDRLTEIMVPITGASKVGGPVEH